MKTVEMIPAQTFCIDHNIEFSFIDSLQRFGLIEVITEEETAWLPERCVPELEQYIRLNKELDINLEGIDAIIHLLQRVKNMQDEIVRLKNKLSLYEIEEHS